MNLLLRYSLCTILLLSLGIPSLPTQVARTQHPTPQISLASPLPPLTHWFQHVPEALTDFRGIVLAEAPTITLHPVLPYIFFDSASSKIPERYALFDAPVDSTQMLEPACSDDLACHYQVLNILGARLRRYPDLEIAIVGYNAESRGGEDSSHSRGRARSVQDYLHRVWGIDIERMTVEAVDGAPMYLGICATSMPCPRARRVEIAVRSDTVRSEGWHDRRNRRDSLSRVLFIPATDTMMRQTVFPPAIFLNVESGLRKENVVNQYLEVRYNGVPVDHVEEIDRRMDSMPYLMLRAVPNEIPRGGGTVSFRLIVLDSRGRRIESNELQLPVVALAENEGRERFATQREVVRARVISALWHEDPDPVGSVAQGTVNCLRAHTIGRFYGISVLTSVDSAGHFDKRLRYSQLVAATYQRAMHTEKGEPPYHILSVGLASGGLLGFSLPEERVLAESTYIVLDFPRCTPSVPEQECRFNVVPDQIELHE